MASKLGTCLIANRHYTAATVRSKIMRTANNIYLKRDYYQAILHASAIYASNAVAINSNTSTYSRITMCSNNKANLRRNARQCFFQHCKQLHLPFRSHVAQSVHSEISILFHTLLFFLINRRLALGVLGI